jgi:hypothetical protein
MKLLILFVALIGSASAVEMGDACSDRGFQNMQSAWVWSEQYINVNGSNVDVWGNARKAYWNSTLYIDGVIYKSNNRSYLLDGGFNGTVPKTILSNDMQWIVFCNNSSNEVPEFTAIGMIIALGVVLSAALTYRKLYK